jgi:hypothetical protein
MCRSDRRAKGLSDFESVLGTMDKHDLSLSPAKRLHRALSMAAWRPRSGCCLASLLIDPRRRRSRARTASGAGAVEVCSPYRRASRCALHLAARGNAIRGRPRRSRSRIQRGHRRVSSRPLSAGRAGLSAIDQRLLRPAIPATGRSAGCLLQSWQYAVPCGPEDRAVRAAGNAAKMDEAVKAYETALQLRATMRTASSTATW